MLQLDHVSLRRGPELLLDQADLTVHAGQKVGLVGANGTGKSSLFALLQGELDTDSGTVHMPKDWRLAWMAQEVPALDQPAIEYVLDGDPELRRIETGLADAEAAGDGSRVGELHAELSAIDGYTARARAARLIRGLGFDAGDEAQAVADFSGGWRIRLNLARTLMARADLLLLDEPTNHLDLDAVIRLQDWLAAHPATLLLISHDRDFLDAVGDQIAHLEGGQLRVYKGGFSAFEEQYAEARRHQQAAHEKQQAEVARIQRFIERFRSNASKARQAQSRLKALERMERVAPAHGGQGFSFSFPEPERLPDPMLAIKGLQAGYGDTTILSGVSLELHPGDRIALLGPNGAGKSTLVRAIAGDLTPQAGEQLPSPHLRVGYFAQHQVDSLDPDASPMAHLQRIDPSAKPQTLRDFLGGFGFRGQGAESPVAPFSGGEKARLALALVVYQKPNLLLLDEPTNHLDMEMRHALTLALQEFTGALVLIAHDRHLLRSVTDYPWLVADGRVQTFDGDLDDYRRWLLSRGGDTPADTGSAPATETAPSAREQRQAQAAQREALKPLRQEAKRLEQEVERLTERKQELDRALADPTLYAADAPQDRLQELIREQGQVAKELTEAEEAWLAANERLEAAED